MEEETANTESDPKYWDAQHDFPQMPQVRERTKKQWRAKWNRFPQSTGVSNSHRESAFPRVLAEIQTIRSKTQYAFRQVLPNARNALPKYWRFRNIAGQIEKAGFPPSTGICNIHRVQECLSRAGGLLMRGALPSVLPRYGGTLPCRPPKPDYRLLYQTYAWNSLGNSRVGASHKEPWQS